MEAIAVVLPLHYVPSVNHRYRLAIRRTRWGKRYMGRVVRPEARAWENTAMELVLAAMVEAEAVPKVPLTIVCTWYWPNRRRRDPDNVRKALHDAIARAVGLDDRDFLAHDLAASVDAERPRVEVLLTW